MDEKMLSVIIPVHNAEKYLLRCINSILKQEYQNLEIILIDDGSTDNSGNLCDHIAGISPKVSVIHQANKGVSAARNIGLKISKGEYIHFCDADDTLVSDAYPTIMKQLLDNDADAAYFGWFRVRGRHRVSQAKEALEGTGNQYDLGYTMLIQCGTVGGSIGYGNYIWNKIFKKSKLYDSASGALIEFDENTSVAEDGIWLVNVLKNISKGVFLPESYYNYFMRPGSVTYTPERYNEVRLASQKSHIRMLNILKEFNTELYEVHKETCNNFFWYHLLAIDPESEDTYMLEETIKNLLIVNDGECPPPLRQLILEYLSLRDLNLERRKNVVRVIRFLIRKVRGLKRRIRIIKRRLS